MVNLFGSSPSPTPSSFVGLYSPLSMLFFLPIPPPAALRLERLAKLSGLVCSLMNALNSCGASSGCKLAGSQNKSCEVCAAAIPSGIVGMKAASRIGDWGGLGKGWSDGSACVIVDRRRISCPVSAAAGAVGEMGPSGWPGGLLTCNEDEVVIERVGRGVGAVGGAVGGKSGSTWLACEIERRRSESSVSTWARKHAH